MMRKALLVALAATCLPAAADAAPLAERLERNTQRVVREHQADMRLCEAGHATAFCNRWASLVSFAKTLPDNEAKAFVIDEVIDAITYVTDHENHWQAPRALFALGGDCEDMALAKALALVEAGVDPLSVYITRYPGHVVAMLETELGLLVLDNKTDWPTLYVASAYATVPWTWRLSMADAMDKKQ